MNLFFFFERKKRIHRKWKKKKKEIKTKIMEKHSQNDRWYFGYNPDFQ